MRTVEPSLWWVGVVGAVEPGFGRRPRLGRNELRLRRGLRRAGQQYLRTCSVPGVRLAVPLREQGDSMLWVVCLMCVSVLGAAAACYSCWWRAERQPRTAVTMPFQKHTITDIHFPAVALCPYNLLSKARLDNYAQFLESKKKNSSLSQYRKWSRTDFYLELRKYASLVTMAAPPVNKTFVRFLRELDPDKGYNTTHLIYTLSMPCSEQIEACSWRGVAQPCSQLFAARVTSLGFCCVFNSRYELYDRKNPVQSLSLVGQDEGLSVILRRTPDDHAFLRRFNRGTEVLIFDGFEYPLLEGGAVRSYSAALNVSVFVALSAKELQVDQYVQNVPYSKRGCRMRHSRSKSFSWCLLECKRKAVRDLCGCVLHYHMPGRGDQVCSINHLHCLNKYKEKLLFYFPEDVEWSEALGEEFARSLSCTTCRPDCARIRYSASVYTGTYYDGYKIFKNAFTSNMRYGNTTVLRVYYTTEDQKLYVLNVHELWHDFVGAVGGQFRLLAGLSFVAGFELLYHLLVRWPYNCLTDRHTTMH